MTMGDKMREIGFHELYAKEFDVSKLAGFNQKWVDNCEFEMASPRKSSALLYFENCDAVYIFNDGTKLNVKKGDIVYIPQNSVYKTVFFSKNDMKAHTMLIEFELRDDNGPFCISNNVFVAVREEKTRFVNSFSDAAVIFAMSVFPIPAFKALVLNLLFTIASRYRHVDSFSKEFKSIAPAVKYIEMNSDIEKSVSELAEMCYMSEAYFRTLFKKCFGISPAEYCTKLKISNAKKLLKSGFYSVSEVSSMLGFKDSGYFNKVFKKYTGLTPGKYK